MKNSLIAALLTLFVLPAFAQYYPLPIPCQVAALDSYNRTLAIFHGRTDYVSGQCREGFRKCNYEIRRRGWWDARCVLVRGRGR